MIMKKLFYAGLSLLACVWWEAATAQQHYTITGRVQNIPSAEWVYISEDWTGVEMKDSVPVKNGVFRYAGTMSKPWPTLAILYMKYFDVEKGKVVRRMMTDFFMEKGNIRITIKNTSFRDGSIVEGTTTNKDYFAYSKHKDDFLKNRQRHMDALGDARPKGQAAMDAYREELRNMATGFVQTHSGSYISLFLLEDDLVRVSNPDQLAAVFNQLSPALKNSEKGKAVSGAIENANRIKVNIIAPGFTEKDTSGVAVSLSSYKGQYVLVDFWASWCHPCRAENPYLKSAFEEYKGKNFTILSVSLDNSRKAWISAIQKDSLPWNQVSALDPQKSESVYKYGIKSIPRNFLVDPNGKIVAMDLRGKDLAAKLAEILKTPS